MERPGGDITRLLHAAAQGDRSAFQRVFPLVYDELKNVASARLAVERDGHTLNATALVHEAYLKLVDNRATEWQSRSHFFAIAAQAMRRILIDHAKRRNAQRRGKGESAVPLEFADAERRPDLFNDVQAADLIALNDALDELSRFNPRGADVVQYRFFGGLANPEIGEVLGISEVTVRRAWTVARAWLRGRLGDEAAVRTETLMSRPEESDA